MHGFFGKRQRQQVVKVTIIAAVTEVFAVQRHLVVIEEHPDFLQEFDVQRGRSAQRQGQAVTGQRKTFGQCPQCRAMGAADTDPVLRRNFQKVEVAHRRGLEVFH
ncbi:hypothetical protein D3C87_1691890 [compost metagenome]